jgi:voltage-gated potassium channel
MISGKSIDGTTASSGAKRILRGLLMLGLVLVIGTMGYMVIEAWHLLDSLYMTVITITTVGYGEIRAVDEIGRIFTILLIFMGMGIMAYTLGMVAQNMVELQVRSILGRRKMDSEIRSIKNHYILCGYGRIGRIISQELKVKRTPSLIIDNDPASEELLEHQDIPYIIDDATSEDVLIERPASRGQRDWSPW